MMWHLADARFSREWRFIQQSHRAGCIVNPSLWICVTSMFPRSKQAVYTCACGHLFSNTVLNQSFFSFFANKSKLSFESSLTQGAAKQPINNSSSQRQRHSCSAHLLICGHTIDPQPQCKLEKRCLWAAFFPLSSIEEEVFKKRRRKQWFFPLKFYFWKNIGREQWAVWQFFCCVSFPRCFCKKSRISCTLWFKGLMCQDSPQQWGEEPQFPATGNACTVLDEHRLFSSVQFSETLR